MDEYFGHLKKIIRVSRTEVNLG